MSTNYVPITLVTAEKLATVQGATSDEGLEGWSFIDDIVSANKYTKILSQSFLTSIAICQFIGRDFVFQQRCTLYHNAKKLKIWVEKLTSSSPALSSIEPLWHTMKKQLRKNLACTVNEPKTKIYGILVSVQPGNCKTDVPMSDRPILK